MMHFHECMGITYEDFPYRLIIARDKDVFRATLVCGDGPASQPAVIIARDLFLIFSETPQPAGVEDAKRVAFWLAHQFLDIAWGKAPIKVVE